jgi:hypothetical protein
MGSKGERQGLPDGREYRILTPEQIRMGQFDPDAETSEPEKGLVCPACRCVQFSTSGKSVTRTLRMIGAIRRERICRNCQHVWWTVER